MNLIQPNWSVPSNIRSFVTTRAGGFSLPPYDSFNLGAHVGDALSAVKSNRTLLVEQARLPQYPYFLTQTHSTKVLRLPYSIEGFEADAVYSNQPDQVCLVMTADCLPVLFTNKQGNEVAAAHAGWRGLCDGILEQTVAQFSCAEKDIIAWFGPAIGPANFQVGEEVVQQFVTKDPQAIEAFVADPRKCGKFLGNLYLLAQLRLQKLGIQQISGGEYCTYDQQDLFFSYRRDNQTGRMASLIWFTEN